MGGPAGCGETVRGRITPGPRNGLVGILLTRTGTSTPDSARAMQDFWTTLYQAIDG
ncbi:hypothetical protein [Streptomyces virginiae]|uniref:hypothetical protein n=1 Tax=Streptomyces virginiae TaxID=1961 RepID=UPI00224F5D21|nr:hypothetical protein [Streptomyces virginiae]MCX4717751.1 hypothetical protein [Streptomyces virginiae]